MVEWVRGVVATGKGDSCFRKRTSRMPRQACQSEPFTIYYLPFTFDLLFTIYNAILRYCVGEGFLVEFGIRKTCL
jgi:hypothetical protein